MSAKATIAKYTTIVAKMADCEADLAELATLADACESPLGRNWVKAAAKANGLDGATLVREIRSNSKGV